MKTALETVRRKLNGNSNLGGLKQESIDVSVWTTKEIEKKALNGDAQVCFLNRDE